MELKEIIYNILRNGRQHYLRDITNKANLTHNDAKYTNSDVYNVIVNDLKNKVKFNEITHTYYIKSRNRLPQPTSEEEYIIYALALSKGEMTAIDIANYVKENYRKRISQIEVETQIFTVLKDRVGYIDSRPIRYYLKEN